MAILQENWASQFPFDSHGFEAKSFYMPDALPIAQPTPSKHLRMMWPVTYNRKTREHWHMATK